LTIPKCVLGEFEKETFKVLSRHSEIIFYLLTTKITACVS